MRSVALLSLLVGTVAASGWLGDEFWTMIGPQGHPTTGSVDDFARVANFFNSAEENLFVAYWMTNTHYPGRMFDQFGEAYIEEDTDKICARFAGKDGEGVETCGNFRVLSVPARLRGQKIFEWTSIASDPELTNAIRFNDHIVCGLALETKVAVMSAFGWPVDSRCPPASGRPVAGGHLESTGHPKADITAFKGGHPDHPHRYSDPHDDCL